MSNEITVKEKVINQSISIIEKRLLEIEDIEEQRPLSEVIKIRQECQKLLEDNQGIEKRTSVWFTDKILELANREKKYIKMAKEYTGDKYMKLMDEKAKLIIELSSLRSELWQINFRKNPRNF